MIPEKTMLTEQEAMSEYFKKCDTLVAFWLCNSSKIKLEYIDELVAEGFLEQKNFDITLTDQGRVVAEVLYKVFELSQYLFKEMHKERKF
jgi:hypothetical protein